jgi:predicted CXXCH cytochrome family protein
VRRWTLLLAGAALWLFLAAIPALADGGPHVAAANSGVSTLTADGCAGCHRAHTAQGPLLLAAPNEEALCLSCHGATGTGAATNVELGVQYTAANDGTPADNAVLGALRGGGFIEARIGSNNVYRVAYNRYDSTTHLVAGISFRTKVSVKSSGQAVTSAHLALVGATGVSETGKAWGNGALNSGVGPGVTLECASCHNPHGNGNYRILNPMPNPAADSSTGTFTAAATPGAVVTDAALPAAGQTRNYTVIQTKGGTGTLLASQVAVLPSYSNTMGDYLHRTVPWDPQVSYVNEPASGITANDAPNGIAGSFNGQINAWCATCHTRYLATATYPTGSGSYNTDSGDATFKYRHSNTSNKPCTTCHVAHGSNAQMPGDFSKVFPYPDGTTAASSRLLKIDNRGTCEACHDPTTTITAGTVSPAGATAPALYVP